MDIRMPKSSGIEACRVMKEAAPSTKIVMLTISDEEEDLFEAIRAGASGYLLKDIPLDEVAEAVRAVHGGQSLISPAMAGKLLTEFATLARRPEEERAQQVPPPKLTDREMEVLKLVAKGMSITQRVRALADRSQRPLDTTKKLTTSTANIGTNTEPSRTEEVLVVGDVQHQGQHRGDHRDHHGQHPAVPQRPHVLGGHGGRVDVGEGLVELARGQHGEADRADRERVYAS